MRTLPALVVIASLLSVHAAGQSAGKAAAPAAKPGAPSFQREVLPLFRTACVGCHGETSPSGGLTLTSYTALMKGGRSGAAIVPGRSADSRLVRMMRGVAMPQMPPGGALKAADIERVRRWVDAGAIADALPATPGKAGVAATAAAAAPARPAAPLGKLLRVPVPVAALAFSPDGHTLAVGLYRQVQFWDVATRRLTGTWAGHADAVHALAYTRDGKWLAAGGGVPGATGEVRVWDVGGAREARTFGDQTDIVNALAISPDGSRLASGSADKTIRLWELATGKAVAAALRDHSDAIWALSWSPDGKNFVSASSDKSFKVWDAASGRRLYSVGAHEEILYDAAFSPDGHQVVTASADRTAKVWNFGPESAGHVRTLSGHEGAVLAVAFTPDGGLLATSSADHSVRLWNARDGAAGRVLAEPKDWVYSVRFSPDGRHLAAGAWDGSLYLWKIPDGALEASWSSLPGVPAARPAAAAPPSSRPSVPTR